MADMRACRKCGAILERTGDKFCPGCGTPVSVAFPVSHEDAIREFEHHESVLQNYRSMFLVSETFTVSIAATRVNTAGSETFIPLLAVFGALWLLIWIIVTDLRAKVVRFFEEHDEDGALMRYHHHIESLAHRAGFWFFTVVLPATFAVLWLSLLLVEYHVMG